MESDGDRSIEEIWTRRVRTALDRRPVQLNLFVGSLKLLFRDELFFELDDGDKKMKLLQCLKSIDFLG